MTHISQISALYTSKNNKRVKSFQVDVVTFDGEQVTVEVEAHTAEEASTIAAEQVGNADYTMVYMF